jgi:hypothetical protein
MYSGFFVESAACVLVESALACVFVSPFWQEENRIAAPDIRAMEAMFLSLFY